MNVLGSRSAISIVILIGLAAAARAGGAAAPAATKLPITTKSQEAMAAYLKARDLAERLRGTDAHAMYAEAVAKDGDFASAYLGLAQSSGTAKDFFDALAHAVAVADKASPGERLLIKAADAGARNDVAAQKRALDEVVRSYPQDERVQNAIGQYYFARQDWNAAIASYNKAIKINPSFSQPYNQLGYAYRFTDKLPEAEKAFTKYIELIPDDPNPYDSYAELLMQEGKLDDSIKNYQKALAIDPNFISSYVGIANDQMFAGRGADARATLAKLTKVARTDGERRQALQWTAMSYAHEGAWDKALAELDKAAAIATAAKALADVAADDNLMGDLLLEAGRPADAAAKFAAQQSTIEASDVPPEVKAATRRNALFDDARIAIAKEDLATAKAKAAAYGTAVAAKKVPFELWRQHELLGRIAIAEGKHKVAVAELGKANLRDPRVMYLAAVAMQGAGDAAGARAMAKRVAEFNGLAFDYAYVRAKAAALLAPAAR
jgi:tetratricopeptide (TPR) repeat protein